MKTLLIILLLVFLSWALLPLAIVLVLLAVAAVVVKFLWRAIVPAKIDTKR